MEHPLWDEPRVIVTPHNAGRHDRYVDNILELFCENLAHLEAGNITEMRNIVRLPVSGSDQ